MSVNKNKKSVITRLGTHNIPALQGCTELLLHLASEMGRREIQFRENCSLEALHDFRVVVRKTRSLLAIVDDVLPEPGLTEFRHTFSTVMKKTGVLRDLEGYCAEFAHSASDAGEHDPHGMGPLLVYIQQQERAERLQVQKYLGSVAYKRSMRDWFSYLQHSIANPVSGPHTLKRADVPIAVIARKAIANSHNRTVKRAATIRKNKSATAFHKLRKSYKQLRYLMDIFRQLLPAPVYKDLSKQLKKLQTRLGSLQDMEVQLEIINRSVDEIRGQLKRENKQAIKSLIKKIKSRRKQLKAGVAELILEFRMTTAEKFAVLIQAPHIAEVSVENRD